MNILEELKSVLKKDGRLVSDDKLLKNRIVELGLKLDKDLIKLLLSNKRIKEHFFTEVDGTLVFDKEKFMKFIDNKEFLPDSYTAFKNKIGLTADKRYIAKSKEVVLSWPYKDCVLEGGQEKEDEKRKEIFHNEILAPDEIDRLLDPKVFTDFKRIDAKGEHEVTDIKSNDNLIIKGNNLLVLHSLKKRFVGEVELIYIDPPYNTGNDEFKYNDSFNHSTWLTFMKNRLEVAKELLKDDGVIFVQCDDNEAAYLKVLMDEVFGREKFLSTIAYQRSGVAGLGQGGKFIVNVTEYINAYAKELKQFEAFDLESGVPLKLKHMKRYNGILKKERKRKFFHEFKSKATGENVKIFKHRDYKIDKISLADFKNKKAKIMETYLKYFKKIFRLNIPQKENTFQHKIISSFKDNGLYSVEYRASRGRYKGEVITNYYYKKQLLAWLKSSAKKEGDTIIKTNKMSDFWTHEEIPKADLANEGRVILGRGKKPEQLLKRIIGISTKEKNVVLDFFMGTGTTCAVAHKMRRQYIGVEQLDYGENDSVVRLKNVIGKANSTGKLAETIEDYDASGISKAVNWKGGGDFVYCELKELNEEFIQKIKKAEDTKELLKIWEEMKEHAFLSYKIDPKDVDENAEEFKDLSLEDQKKFLIECLDKNNLYVNYSEIEDKQYNVSKEDIKLNNKFYGRL